MTKQTVKSDEKLQEAIADELEWEPSVHSSHIEVQVKKGVVTLSGTVNSCYEQWEVENVARRILGVRGLINETQVALEDDHKRQDAEISAAVQNVLDWTTSLSTESIASSVKNGWVTLTGSVSWQFQRVAVTNAVRSLNGVLGVTDEITLNRTASAAAVRADIEAALKRSAVADAQKISVAVNGAQVTLGGSVSSWSEHAAATGAAWNSPGVTDVVDKLTTVY